MRRGKSRHLPNEGKPYIPASQTALLLYGAKQPYRIVGDYPVPHPQNDQEVLVKTLVIGLNPIDWKAPWVLFLGLGLAVFRL